MDERMKKKIVYVLSLPDSQIVGVVDNEKFAQDWVNGTDDREYKEYEINKVQCEEYKHVVEIKTIQRTLK